MTLPYLIVVLASPGVTTVVPQTAPSARAVPSYELSWLRGPGTENCPSGSELAREVEAYVGPSSAARGERAFEAQVSHAGSSFEVSLRLRDRDGKLLGERTLVSEDCPSVLRATAFAVALALDPNAVKRARPTSEPAQSATPPPSEAPPAQILVEPAPLPARDNARDAPAALKPLDAPQAPKLVFGAWGRASVVFFLLPAPRLAPELGASVASERSRLTLGAGYYASTSTDDGAARVGLTSFWLSGGHSFVELERWGIGGEAGLGMGAWHAQAQGRGMRERLFVGTRIGGYVERPILGELAIEFSASAVIPFHRYQFQTSDGRGFRLPPAGILVGLGINYEGR